MNTTLFSAVTWPRSLAAASVASVETAMAKGSSMEPDLSSQFSVRHAAFNHISMYLCYLVSVPMLVLLAAFYNNWLNKSKYDDIPLSNAKVAPSPEVKKWVSRRSVSKSKPTEWYRQMFYKLQNLEEHADVLECARDELLSMFSRAISLGRRTNGIFDLEHYDAQSVDRFIESEHDRVMGVWTSYLKRREQGTGPELFQTAEGAKEWLVQQAPVKFVDGAWLAHVHKITTPFALRTVTKNAWQVLSEELGDGDLSKHHVYLYHEMLRAAGQDLPEGHTADFIDPRHWVGKDNHAGWRNAVGQLLISLFPDEFLPEILGFNMHYELITLDTMRANHELREFGINPYYFLIHIVIDNGDSGHTAMATHTVTRYLDMIRETQGEAAVEQAWKRVQVGYSLSANLGHVEWDAAADMAIQSSNKSAGGPLSTRNLSLDVLSARILNIFKAKATCSHQFHCQSRARIGGHTLAEWLAPSMWSDSCPEKQLQLLTGLSQAKPWIYPGASEKSMLIRELGWKGKMFGAFTHDETAALAAWINALGPNGTSLLYWNYTCRDPSASKAAVSKLQDPTRHHPVFMPEEAHAGDADDWKSYDYADSEFKMTPQTLAPPSRVQLPDMIALWFAHICLLENTINTPARTASPIYARILCVLRAQAGFAIETPIVAGMDEFRRFTCPSLVDLGRELISQWNADATVESLHDVLILTAKSGQSERSIRLCNDMLRWATRPQANLGFLLGLACAFVELKDAVARSQALPSQESRCVLRAIIARERQGLEECVQELRAAGEEQHCQGLSRGYELGMKELQSFCNEPTGGE